MNIHYEFDEKFNHEITLEVPFYMTDYGGGVYHSRYLDLYQQARDSFFAASGFPYKNLMARGYYILIVEAHVEYKKAIQFFDDIMIRTRLVNVKGKSFFMIQEMWRKDGDGEVLCNRLQVTHVCVTQDRKTVVVPDFFVEKIAGLQNRNAG